MESWTLWREVALHDLLQRRMQRCGVFFCCSSRTGCVSREPWSRLLETIGLDNTAHTPAIHVYCGAAHNSQVIKLDAWMLTSRRKQTGNVVPKGTCKEEWNDKCKESREWVQLGIIMIKKENRDSERQLLCVFCKMLRNVGFRSSIK